MKLNVDDKVELLVTKEQREVSQGIEAIDKESRGCLLPREFDAADKKDDGQLGGVVKQTDDGKEGNVDLYTAGECRMRRKIENMVNKEAIRMKNNCSKYKVKYHQCVPYNVPNSVIALLPSEIRICSGEEQLNETIAKDLDTECLEECFQRSFSTSVMSSSMFDDPGDFFYSRLLRRPRSNSPSESPKFWVEYVQYVTSLGSTKVLGPPRCHNCFQFVFLILFL